jgi:radical SAM superfamily enzyme YgiQ (UPF0313 family)
LDILNKRTTVEMNRRACAYVNEAGLDLGASFMVGVPGETEEEIQETLTFIRQLDCNAKGCGSFRPLPGSPFYAELLDSGELRKESLNWANLGNFSAPPEHIFCAVGKTRFLELYKEAAKLVYGNQYIAVHEDIANDCPELVSEMRMRQSVRIASWAPNTDLHLQECN